MAEVERFELPRPFGRLISNQLQYHCAILPDSGGQRGIRTPDTIAGMPVFKTSVFSRSTICPVLVEAPGFEPR